MKQLGFEVQAFGHIHRHAGFPSKTSAWLSLAVDVTERLNLEAQLLHSQKMESVGQLADIAMIINGHTGLLLAMDNLAPKVADPIRDFATPRAAPPT